MRKPNRHRVKKSSFHTDMKVLFPDCEVIYSGWPDRPMIESVIVTLPDDSSFDILPTLLDEEIEELQRQAANREADLTDYYYDQYREAQAEDRDQ